MVKTNKVLTPQAYLALVTKKLYFVSHLNPIAEIQSVLSNNKLVLLDYPLDRINEIYENGLSVVLVDCSNSRTGAYEQEFRWFEVPDGVIINE